MYVAITDPEAYASDDENYTADIPKNLDTYLWGMPYTEALAKFEPLWPVPMRTQPQEFNFSDVETPAAKAKPWHLPTVYGGASAQSLRAAAATPSKAVAAAAAAAPPPPPPPIQTSTGREVKRPRK